MSKTKNMSLEEAQQRREDIKDKYDLREASENKNLEKQLKLSKTTKSLTGKGVDFEEQSIDHGDIKNAGLTRVHDKFHLYDQRSEVESRCNTQNDNNIVPKTTHRKRNLLI